MRFEGRELKPYAEPVSAAALSPGSVYFSVSFLDDDMQIPIIDTLVFVGTTGKTKRKWRFQDAESFRQGVSFGSAGHDSRTLFVECSEQQLSNVFDYEKALDVLMRCSLRRRSPKGRSTKR